MDKRKRPIDRRTRNAQPALFQWELGNEHGKALVVALEMFLDEHPAWSEGMDFLATINVQPDDAMLAVWYSLPKKDRGTREELARRLGVSRAVTYQWEDRHTYPVRDAVLTIEDLGRVLRLKRVGTWVPDIERRLYLNATRADANAAIIALALKYAGALDDDLTLHVQGKGDSPITIKRADEMTDDELAALAQRGGQGTDQQTPGA
jgi:DNA-binding XRE family transcriptional regulator